MTTTDQDPSEGAVLTTANPGWSSPRELREWLRRDEQQKRSSRGQRRSSWLEDIAGLLIVAVVAAWIGWRTGAFRGFPKGYDDYGHLSYVVLLEKTFPHMAWNSAWYGGTQGIPGLYGPAYHLLVLGAAHLIGKSLASTMVALTVVFTLLTAGSIYVLVRLVTQSRVGAVVAGLILLATPALWQQALLEGEYARLMAISCAALTLALAALYARRPSRFRLMGVVIACGLALLSHQEAGVVALISALGMILIVPEQSLADRFRAAGVALLGISGLVAFFYVPLVAVPTPEYLENPINALTLVHDPPIGLNLIFGYHADAMMGAAFLTLPLAVMSLVVIFVDARRNLRARRVPEGVASWRVAVVLLIVPLCIVFYSLPDLNPSTNANFSSVKPGQLVIFLAVSAAALIGLGIAALERNSPPLLGAGIDIVALGLAAWLVIGTVFLFPPALDGNTSEQRALAALLPPEALGTQMYRIGGLSDDVTSWINAVTTTPQIRGYINQQNLHGDWQYWLESSLGNPHLSLAEREYFFQWWAIKWMYAGPGLNDQQAYLHAPKIFSSVGSPTAAAPYQLVQYNNAQPVASATAAPTLLVISQNHNTYDYFLRQTGLAGRGPTSVIPLEGDQPLDSYSLRTLERFSSVAIYGTTPVINPAAVGRTLRAYAAHGGHVLLEGAGNEPTLAAISAAGGPIPVSLQGRIALGSSWNFAPAPSLSATARAQLATFSPPNVGGGIWNVDTAIALAPGTHTLLRSHNKVVLAELPIGRGAITWSGLNLPYHCAVSHLSTEASFNLDLLGLSSPTLKISAHVHMPLTGPITVTAPGTATGVLLKENLTPDWHASVDGHPTKIFLAGPGYMYVPLEPGTSMRSVKFTYELSTAQNVGIIVSIATVALLFLVAILPWRQLRRWRTTRLRRRGLAL